MIVLGDQIQQLFHPNLSEPSIKYSRSSEEASSASVLVQCLSGLSGEYQTYPEQCSRGLEHRLKLHPGGPRGLWRGQLQPHHVAHLLRTTETMLWDQLCVLQNIGQSPEHPVGLQEHRPILHPISWSCGWTDEVNTVICFSKWGVFRGRNCRHKTIQVGIIVDFSKCKMI